MPIIGKTISIPAKEFNKYWIVNQGTTSFPGQPTRGQARLAPYREVDGAKEFAPESMWVDVSVENVWELAAQTENGELTELAETVGFALEKVLGAWEAIAKEQDKI